MRFLRLRRPSPALAIAVIALVVALGGSAYAVRQISGSTIRIRSIPGNRIANNALTGTQINEARLGRVNEARNATNSKFALRASAADSAANALNSGSARSADTLAGSPPTAFQGRIRWAVVSSTGAVVDQSGGIASATAHTSGSPTYVIDFGADLSHKALLVTPNGASPQPVSAQLTDSTHVQVTVGTSSGGSFFVAVVG
jgi:hypothetical protein